jgi:hypothetical protein
LNKSAVVAFAFGVPHSIRSNQRIADMARDSPLIYTQRDIRIKNPVGRVDYTEEKEGEPPPTLRIARGAVQWAMNLGITELWIACALPHLWRCRRDLEYAIEEAGGEITVWICEEVMEYPMSSWFCPDSTQPRTGSQKAWVKRERILWRMPMVIYKLIAS